jgi:TatD DNase family protein
MRLIDTHCHLTYEELASQMEAVLRRAQEAGVRRCITIGEDPDDGARCVELTEKHSAVFAAVGIHPHRAARFAGADLSGWRELLAHPRVVAAGEMGLDYHYEFADRKSQWRVFEAQLETCARADLPVVIHSREATEDTVKILRDAGFGGRRVVFHCFTGSPSELRRIRDQGWRTSFTGVVTFKNAGDIRRVAREYPADEMMIETDAPFLSPEPIRNVRPNEPAHVVHTARFLAELRGQRLEELAEQTTRNAVEFFGLDDAAEAS